MRPPGSGEPLPAWHAATEAANGARISELHPQRPDEALEPKAGEAGSTLTKNEALALSSSFASATTGEPFRFLDLPREVRDQIYDSMVQNQWPKGAFTKQPPMDYLQYNWSMLALNRQIQHEFARILCINKEQCEVSAATTEVYEHAAQVLMRGPYYYKLHQPFTLNLGTLPNLAMFTEFLQSLDIFMTFMPLPGRTRRDPRVTIPDEVRLSMTDAVIAALRDARNLRRVRVRLRLVTGMFEIGWVSRELERLKAIPGFQLAQLVVKSVNKAERELSRTLWAVPQADGTEGWEHRPANLTFVQRLHIPHAQGFDEHCFECWREAQKAGLDKFPAFRYSDSHHQEESFLKFNRLEAPELTWSEWENHAPRILRKRRI